MTTPSGAAEQEKQEADVDSGSRSGSTSEVVMELDEETGETVEESAPGDNKSSYMYDLAWLFVMVVVAAGVIALGVYSSVIDGEEEDDEPDDAAVDGNDEQQTKFSHHMVEYFFDENCLNEMASDGGGDDESPLEIVDAYMVLIFESLAIFSVIKSNVQVRLSEQ
jgi:hypothetical protein